MRLAGVALLLVSAFAPTRHNDSGPRKYTDESASTATEQHTRTQAEQHRSTATEELRPTQGAEQRGRTATEQHSRTQAAQQYGRTATEQHSRTHGAEDREEHGPQAAAAAPIDPKQRELALAVLERSSRPFAVYCARRATDLTVVVELSAAAIQAGRWKSGADVEAAAASADGTPLSTARGRLDAGVYAASIPVPLKGDAAPGRVTVTLRSPDEKAADEWVRLYPTSDTLAGAPLVWRSANRITPRPVAAFEFARNERARIEWPVLGPIGRRSARLLDRTGRVLVPSLTLADDPAQHTIVLDLALSNLIKGDYLVDLEAANGSATERHLLAIRIR